MGGNELATLLIGAALGAGFTLFLQLFSWSVQHIRLRRFLKISLGLLNRHLVASEKSLSGTTADQPIYLQVARVRFCKVSTAILPDDMNRLGMLTRSNERARILLTAVHNSDIFLDEVADRLGSMSFEGRAKALADARENIAILGRIVSCLGQGGITTLIDPTAEIATKSQVDGVAR